MANNTENCISFFILLFLLSEGNFMITKAQTHGDWCVAKPSADKKQLLKNINYACSKIDCATIMEGGTCYYPDNLAHLASVAMNLYYQAEGRNHWNCNFDGSGLIGITDPSYGNCVYQFRK